MKFKENISKSNILIILFSIALFLVVINLPIKAKMFGDMDFHQEAKVIASFVHGKTSFREVYLTKAPGPSIYYAIPYCFVDEKAEDRVFWLAAVCWNLIWLTAALLLLKKTTEQWFGKETGITAVLLVFVLPLPYYYSLGILAETMAFLGFSVYLYGVSSLHHRPGKINENVQQSSFFAGFGLLLMVLARPNMMLVFGLIPVILLLLYKWNYFAPSIKKLCFAFATTTVVTMLIVIGLKRLPGNATKNTQTVYFLKVVHAGRFQFRDEPWDWRFWDDMTRPDSKDYQNYVNSIAKLNKITTEQNQYDLQKSYSDWLVNDLKQRPMLVFKQFFVRMLFGNYLQISSVASKDFKLGPLRGKTGFYLLLTSINLVNLIILVAAIWSFIKTLRSNKSVWLITAPIFALLLFHGVVYLEQRYLFPVRPFLIMFAAPVIHGVFRRLFNKPTLDAA